MRRVLLCIVLLKTTVILAQVDPHFSQFYAYPLALNPGMAGVTGGDYRVTAIYRKQWNQVSPFTTMGLCASVATNKNISFGLNVMNQKAGDIGYSFLNAYGTISYNGIKFGEGNRQQISIGIQAGMLSRKFDPSKFQFGDQWDPGTGGYNAAIPTADALSYLSVSVFDAGAGIFYSDERAGRGINFFGGASAFHLTRPEDPFIAEGAKERLPVRYVFHGGARISVSDNFSLVPNLLYMVQGTAKEKMLGLYAEMGVDEETSMLGGLYYRTGDAVAPYVGISYKHIILGISYDVNISGLGEVAKNANSFELSLTYGGRGKGKPLEYLGCPRF